MAKKNTKAPKKGPKGFGTTGGINRMKRQISKLSGVAMSKG